MCVLIIPAYQPGPQLLNTVRELQRDFDRVVVVNDGSTKPGTRELFESLTKFEGVIVLEHAVNLGKGAALKLALNFVYVTLPQASVIITADADGQHAADDIRKIQIQARAAPESLILGSRSFTGYVPWRSRFGNKVTRTTFRWITGKFLSDTQTGLRSIPRHLIPSLLKISTNGYDFELDMLLIAIRQEQPIIEVPIQSIYEKGNPTSHFNPLFDSMKIYFLLFRFAASALLSAGLDFSLFGLFYYFSGSLLASQTLARAVAAPVNFSLNRAWVFKSSRRYITGLLWYFALVVANCTASFLLIRLLVESRGVPVLIAKAGVEATLFFVNYSVQNELIFRRRPN